MPAWVDLTIHGINTDAPAIVLGTVPGIVTVAAPSPLTAAIWKSTATAVSASPVALVIATSTAPACPIPGWSNIGVTVSATLPSIVTASVGCSVVSVNADRS